MEIGFSIVFLLVKCHHRLPFKTNCWYQELISYLLKFQFHILEIQLLLVKTFIFDIKNSIVTSCNVYSSAIELLLVTMFIFDINNYIFTSDNVSLW